MSESKYEFELNKEEMNDSHMGLAIRIKQNESVLELGCATGKLSKYLSEDKNCRVVGVDIDGHALKQAAPYCDKTIHADLDSVEWLEKIQDEQFDVILCADVIEHLKKPKELLSELKSYLHRDGRLLVSIPNVAHASIRLELLQGHFDYEKIGLLDETHLHFYTRNGLIKLLMDSGYLCNEIAYSIHDMADEAIQKHLQNVGLTATDKTMNLFHAPDAQAYQFVVEAKPVQPELVEHLPSTLSPKPLTSSGVFYGEKQEKIVNLENQVLGLEENQVQLHNNLSKEKIDNENHQKHIQELEKKLQALEEQFRGEMIHSRNHLSNISSLENSIHMLEKQREDEVLHNNNLRSEITNWKQTTSVIDNELFKTMDLFDQEREKNNQLEKQVSNLQHEVNQLRSQLSNTVNHVDHLEGVLQTIHRKKSYRLIRTVKNLPSNIKSITNKPKYEINTTVDSESYTQSINRNFDYKEWFNSYWQFNVECFSAYNAEIASWQNPPKIAVIMPVYNPEKACLINAIESVVQQIYQNFELCIADDASTQTYVREVLETYRQKDSRIKVIYRETNGHISQASNSALELVESEYIALMDHDDRLTTDALYWVAKHIVQHPDAQLFYSDEDKMDVHENHYAPYFKPDWNPVLLYSHNYISHLGVYKTERVRHINGFNSEFDGAQDYDLVLRYVASLMPEQIIHIPRILYHWRAVEGSTANGVHEKPYAADKIVKVVENALKNKQVEATVSPHSALPGSLRINFKLPQTLPLVSIVIPTRNGYSLLRRCVESIFNYTQYSNIEMVIIDNGSDELVTLRYLQYLQDYRNVTVIKDDSPFNYAALNNKAVKRCHGDLIAFLNNDMEIITPGWLDEMVGYALQPEMGAVGAKLYYPDNSIQHAGVIIGLGGVAGHSHKHFAKDHPGFCGRLLLAQNLSAVTAACLVVRKSVFEEVGGFDQVNLSVAFNDVDLCLRIQEQGYFNVWTPYAELYHHESATRGYEDTPEKQARFSREIDYMKSRWGNELLNDPAYNPNLTLDREDFSFAWPLRY